MDGCFSIKSAIVALVFIYTPSILRDNEAIAQSCVDENEVRWTILEQYLLLNLAQSRKLSQHDSAAILTTQTQSKCSEYQQNIVILIFAWHLVIPFTNRLWFKLPSVRPEVMNYFQDNWKATKIKIVVWFGKILCVMQCKQKVSIYLGTSFFKLRDLLFALTMNAAWTTKKMKNHPKIFCPSSAILSVVVSRAHNKMLNLELFNSLH